MASWRDGRAAPKTVTPRFASAPLVVRLLGGQHPGVREVAHGERVIELTPTGSSDRWAVCVIARRHCDDYTAHWLAMRKAVSNVLLGPGGGPDKVI